METRICALIADGLENKEITRRLGYKSHEYVRNMTSKIYAKVGVRNRVELARFVLTGVVMENSSVEL
jgi:DNA-binding NarL/FixJ family response regulator